jgi:hypothetical protein
MYIRKTKDEYQLITNYGYGWEVELTEETYKEAKTQLKCYRENASGLTGIKIKKVRAPL